MMISFIGIVTLVVALVCAGMIGYGFKHYRPIDPLSWTLALFSVAENIVMFLLAIQLFFYS